MFSGCPFVCASVRVSGRRHSRPLSTSSFYLLSQVTNYLPILTNENQLAHAVRFVVFLNALLAFLTDVAATSASSMRDCDIIATIFSNLNTLLINYL